ncbi:MAG: hypothetical protein JNL11_07905 [Bdellovibrionaceae bacterium]|nr:hypothetical protein [Pseudobdellovibrionaceae bacterium]
MELQRASVAERIVLFVLLVLANANFAKASSLSCLKFYASKTEVAKPFFVAQIKDQSTLEYLDTVELSPVSHYKFKKAIRELEHFLFLDSDGFLNEYTKSWTVDSEISLRAIKTLQVVVAVKAPRDQIRYYKLFLFSENAGDHRVLFERLTEAFIKDNLSNDDYNNFNIKSYVHPVYFGQILFAKERGSKTFKYIDSDDIRYRTSYEDYQSNRKFLTKIPDGLLDLHPDEVYEFEIERTHIP